MRRGRLTAGILTALGAALLFVPAASALNPVSFSKTGDMVEKREYPGAARLPDGRVLVVGGYDNVNDLKTAEIYDPNTGTFTESGVPSMSTRRYAPQVVALPDGRVLVAGGYAGTDDVASAELFNPSTSTFSPVAPMLERRECGGAAVLSDGRVLVAGGYDSTASGGSYVDTSEIYNPKTNTWSAGPTMGSRRCGAAVAPISGNRILFAGGYSGGDYLQTSEFFTPAGTFSPGPALPEIRYGSAGAPLPGGRALIASGYNGTANLPGSFTFEPSGNSFTSAGISPMIGKREEAVAVELSDGRALVAGGIDAAISLRSAEILSVPSNSFKAKLKGRKVIFSVTDEGAGEVTDASTQLATTARKKKPKLVKTTTVHGGPGKIAVKIKLTKPGAARLAQKGKLKVKVAYTPDGGLAATKKLKLRAGK